MLWTRIFLESFLQSGKRPRKRKAKKNRTATIYHSSIFDESYINFGASSCIAAKYE